MPCVIYLHIVSTFVSMIYGQRTRFSYYNMDTAWQPQKIRTNSFEGSTVSGSISRRSCVSGGYHKALRQVLWKIWSIALLAVYRFSGQELKIFYILYVIEKRCKKSYAENRKARTVKGRGANTVLWLSAGFSLKALLRAGMRRNRRQQNNEEREKYVSRIQFYRQ